MVNLGPTLIVLCLFACSAALSASDDDITAELTVRLEQLEQYVKKRDDRVATLKHEISEQTAQLKSANEKLRVYYSANGDNSEEGQGNLKHRRAAAVPHVAFSAYLDHRLTHVGIDTIIPFNQVILNDGGAYSPITGVFTVPITGVYLFTYSVNTIVSARQLVVELLLDGVNMSDGISDPFHDLQEIQGGNTVITRANLGQSVWLAAYNTGNTVVDGREDYRFSTLSGVLLYT